MPSCRAHRARVAIFASASAWSRAGDAEGRVFDVSEAVRTAHAGGRLTKKLLVALLPRAAIML
jgi:hypothetical protein